MVRLQLLIIRIEKVVVGLVCDVRDVVYYCKTDKKVKHLDYDDDEIMELINDMD